MHGNEHDSDMRPLPEGGGLLTRLKDIDVIKDRDKEILLTSNRGNYEDKECGKERYGKLREIKRREDKKNK